MSKSQGLITDIESAQSDLLQSITKLNEGNKEEAISSIEKAQTKLQVIKNLLELPQVD